MNILLICGWRRTGKDTVYQVLAGQIDDISWLVYRNPRCGDTSNIFHAATYQRGAFADELKREVAERYQLPIPLPEEDKDRACVILPHPVDGSPLLVTPRQLYIASAQQQLRTDPNCWARRLLDSVQLPTPTTILTIPDWRFRHELDYLHQRNCKVTTARVYRSAVAEPSSDDVTEHDLDNWATDYLLVPSVEDFALACQRLPQYRNYVALGQLL